MHENNSVWQRLLRSKLAIIFEVLVLVLISAALAKEIARRYQIHSEIKKLEAEATRLEQKNTELGSLLNQLNDSTYKEEQARLKLGLQKPGESVVVVMGESTDGQQSAASAALQADSTETTASVTSNPKRWWNYFFSDNKESSQSQA